jgi:uncharacterized protein
VVQTKILIMKKHFALKLIPPRPSFAMDMSDEERKIMEQHVEYWKDLLNKHIAIVFGPVFDPTGAYGLGVVEVDDDAQLKEIMEKDPATQVNRYEFAPMRAVFAGAQSIS